MAYDETILAGATSKIVEVMIRQDKDGSNPGQGRTGIAHGSVTGSYVREGGTRQAITMAAGTVGDAYSTGKWAEVDATNMPGKYQFHVPNGALASGVDAVTLQFKISGAIDKTVRIVLISADLRDANNLGLAYLDAALTARTLAAASYATAANQAAIAGYIDTEVAAIKAVTDALPDSGALTSLAQASALATVDTTVDAIKVTTDKLNDTLEDDAGTFRFTANALEESPSGGSGGDATEAKQDTIIAALAVVDGIVDAILLDTAEIGAAGAGLTEAGGNGDHLTDLQLPADGLDLVLVAGATLPEAIRRIGTITSGKVSNAGTGSETFTDWADSASTIVITVDASGNRTGITYN